MTIKTHDDHEAQSAKKRRVIKPSASGPAAHEVHTDEINEELAQRAMHNLNYDAIKSLVKLCPRLMPPSEMKETQSNYHCYGKTFGCICIIYSCTDALNTDHE